MNMCRFGSKCDDGFGHFLAALKDYLKRIEQNDSDQRLLASRAQAGS